MHSLKLLPVFAVSAFAGDILLPSPALERDRVVTAIYRFNAAANGAAKLQVKWTDVHGRIVEDRTIAATLIDETEIRFPLDVRRAAAMQNRLEVRFSLNGTNKRGDRDVRDEQAQIEFIARPAKGWRDYVILMWQQYNADAFAVLKTMGVNAGQYNGRNRTLPEFLLKNDLRWYAENIATDFYAEYHRWRPDRIQNWSFLQAKELYKTNPMAAFKRNPSLSDPAWIEKIRERLKESARVHSPYRPVFYSLGDESGIADLAAYWDFDFSDHSLVEMREWLKSRYGTLAALNAQWGTNFASWNLVIPETTNEAMKRTDGNFSSWADHKDWMDESFSRALKMGADAVRSVDPEARVGIGGAQMPGWGGYDYSRITDALTALEPYNIGNNVEIIRSLNPSLATMTVAFARGRWEKQRVWYELLHGGRGLIIWDDQNGFVTKDGKPGERGLEVKPYYTELRSGVATLLMNSKRGSGPVAIHYSQPSMRTEWMLAQQPKGEAWVKRTASTERRDSMFLRVRESFCRLLEDLGLQYDFVNIERGDLLHKDYRVLILPHSSALSKAEAAAIQAFAARGGTIVASGQPGTYDEHSRRLEQSSLDGVKIVRMPDDLVDYHQQRLVGKEGATLKAASDIFAAAGVTPRFGVREVGVETHTFGNGGVTILALHSNPQLRVDELGPPEFKSNERFEKVRRLRVSLPEQMYTYAIRGTQATGAVREMDIVLDPYEPAIVALSGSPLPAVRLAAPARSQRGETLEIVIATEFPSPAATHVYNVQVLDPSGKIVPHYSRNVIAERGSAAFTIPLAMNDAAGLWNVSVHDVLLNRSVTARVQVD
jgi:hypothetical protein